jgi:peptidoglycan/xylan/chitin deacetylase (PgdA/CDA1 family)
MVLPTHGRYAYSGIGERPTYEWPNGTRLAVYLGLNLEHFSFGEGLGAELAPGGPQPDVLNYAWRDYGNRVGAWRLLRMLDDLQLPTSVILNSEMYAYAPSLLERFRRRGDEFVGHGRTNSERQSILAEEAERQLITDATYAISQHEGVSPRGWLSPWIAESTVTPDLLHEAGYSYTLNWCADDQPIWLRTRKGRLLAVPYPQELNDIPAVVGRKTDADVFADMIIDNFDEMLDQSKDGPLVMGIALHPYLVGQPFRLRQLRRALHHIVAQKSALWITKPGEIATFCATLSPHLIPGGQPG